ncbi:methionine--tRNA ligase [Candidatus Pacearchaeota archaeon]|nr:methionine--tRNA ligase [Candidatus Pacearchaeota archaeon]PIZ81969.1 MAG: methionine--tRNA ligase [Candidatus Pacearchaeota archaeon CG_4_10_14_0_2_um_filter_30_11]
MKKKFYITTAIDYVNAKPHIGHAFEKVLADVFARWNRQQGKEVFFLTGVDENAQKNVQAAEKAGIPIKDFVDGNSASFLELCQKLNLSHSKFIRTTDKEHSLVVKEIVEKIIKKGDIYKGTYEGLYCVGCEAYYTEKDLVDGKCPEHNKIPELRSEEAYFFRLSKYEKNLKKIIPKYVVPKFRANEVLSRINEGLKDVCVSRRDSEWGIKFPNDPQYTIWVWIDALINYVSGASGNWPADVHIIGKGINWFHSVIWPALLLSAEYELPKKLVVHGYLNTDGKKMSKSLGNVIDPIGLIENYGADSVRYSLLRSSIFEDSDYSEDLLIKRYNNELANKLGNLVSRVSGLIEKNGISETENKLIKKLNEKKVNSFIEKLELDKALNEIFAFIDRCNEYVQDKKPWETGDKKILFELKESILKISELLYPFIPESSEKIKKQFNQAKIKKSESLFSKIDVPINEKTNKVLKIQGIMDTKEVEFSDWEKLDLRVAKIEKVEDVEGADKLYKLTLDVGELGTRIICAGLKQFYAKEKLKGKKIIYFSNLKPRKLKGIESQGMLLAASNKDKSKVSLITPSEEIETGSTIG